MVTAPENDNGLNITRPVAVWNRKIAIAPGKLLQGIGKMLCEGAMQDWSDFGGAALDTLDAAGLRKQPGELAWLLIYRSLTAAFVDLVKNYHDLFRNPPNKEKLGEISALFEQVINEAEVAIKLDFFDRPGDLPLLKQLQAPLTDWLHGLGAAPADAEQIACRLPDYFVTALHETWRAAPQDYSVLQDHFRSPFIRATDEILSWKLYNQWLKRQVGDRMFAEAFGVDKVYVPLRSYYEKKSDSFLQTSYKDIFSKNEKKEDNEEEDAQKQVDQACTSAKKIVFDLETDFRNWLNKFSLESSLRFISGDPGSGKSTFAKIFAAKVADETDIPTLYIPLHLFDATDNLIRAMESHIRGNRYLSGNPLDAKSGKHRLLIIFDGLDELALQGKAASEVANNFVDEVLRRIQEGNSYGLQRQVIITGRTIAVQSVAAKLREEKQISYVLPYFVEKEEGREYQDPDKLLAADQRQEWWQRYGVATGKNYPAMPDDLERKSFTEVTAQPLLNYLVALSYDRKTIEFTDDTTLNQIYADLISAVYCRQYEGGGKGRVNACIGGLEEGQFIRVLEEIALAVWHGDGRTATVAAIRKKCKSGGIDRILEVFQEGAKAGVTRLLTAFYFRQSENRRDGDPTFEFTHKSFGEYLTALRIMRLLRQIQKQMKRQQEDPDDGWSEKIALKKWTEICAVTPLNKDLMRFLNNEFRGMTFDDLKELQTIIRDLLTCTINQGLPFSAEFTHKGFKQHLRLARNAEEGLLAVHCGIAYITRRVSRMRLDSNTAFGAWISRLRGQSQGLDNTIALNSLSFLDLTDYILDRQDFYGANFEMTNFKGAHLEMTNFRRANLEGAKLGTDSLESENLAGANLRGVILEGSEFYF